MIGEGEETILDLAKHSYQGNNNLDEVKGIV